MSHQDFNQASAIQHVARADVLLARQCNLVRELKEKGRPHELAERLLMTMVCTYALMVDHTNKLAKSSCAIPTYQIADQRLRRRPASKALNLNIAMRPRSHDRTPSQSRLHEIGSRLRSMYAGYVATDPPDRLRRLVMAIDRDRHGTASA
jgi:hypothetical protein